MEVLMDMQHYDRKEFEMTRSVIRKKVKKQYLDVFDRLAHRIRNNIRLTHAQCRVSCMEQHDIDFALNYGSNLRKDDFGFKDFKHNPVYMK